jgi:UDP-glucose 4-epimerase
MRVLVTGGAGYIGSHAVRLLRERGDQVVVLDTLELGHRASIGNTPLVVGSTHDQTLVKEVVGDHKIEAVIHFAAYKAAGESMQLPGKYFENNVNGTLGLLQALRQEKVRHVVFSSSSAVYGTPTTLPVRETDQLRPENPYGESKLMVEQMLRWFDACHGLRSVSLRYFNAAGAAEDGRIGEDPRRVLNLIPLVLKAATGRAPAVQVYGTDYPTPDGTAIRDYIHVVDLAEAHLRALDYLRANDRSDIFNLGTGHGISVNEILVAARRISGRDIPAELVGRRAGDPVAIYADNTKARTTLGWQPRFGLEEIIASSWRWQSQHPDGYAQTPT